MNKVIFTGNLTRTPEARYTQSGKIRASFGIAVQRRTKNANGQYDADFFNVVAWDKNAEFIGKYFNKGSRIFIEGHLQTNNYTDTKGVKHYGVDVIVETVEFGSSKRSDEKPAVNSDDDFVGEEIPDYAVPFD